MSVWESAPAYSIGGKSKDGMPRDNKPGPGAYDPKDPTETSPGWKMGTSPRGLKHKSDTPGPGAYESKLYTVNSPKLLKNEKDKKAFLPGPGAYDATNTSMKYAAPPAYSLGARNSVEKVNALPGPGQYEVDSSKIQRGTPAYTLGSRLEAQNRSAELPGPGAYDDKPDVLYKYSSPNTKFGTEKRDGFIPKKEIPAPGTYEIKGSFETGKGYSMLARTGQGALGNSSNLPGPGAYQLNESIVVKNSPAWKLGIKPKDTSLDRLKNLPGPGAYNTTLSHLRGSPGWKMNGSPRMNNKIKQTIPGPGSYEMKSTIAAEGPKYSLRGKEDQKIRNSNPGPGAYDPATNFVNRKDPTFKFGSEARNKFKPKAGPSPGMYDIPSSIGHVPAYAMRGRKLKDTL